MKKKNRNLSMAFLAKIINFSIASFGSGLIWESTSAVN